MSSTIVWGKTAAASSNRELDDSSVKAEAESISPLDNFSFETTPIAFGSSYTGLLINQNYARQSDSNKLASPKLSWGAEYRFFYKDEWTLSVSGEFRGQPDIENRERSTFSISHETSKIFRLYHPWYLAAGGRLSYHIPVKKISIPYERDQSRNVSNGGALSVSSILKINDRLLLIISAQRWASFSSQKSDGVSTVLTVLAKLRSKD